MGVSSGNQHEYCTISLRYIFKRKKKQRPWSKRQVFIQNAEVYIRRYVKSWERKVFSKKFWKNIPYGFVPFIFCTVSFCALYKNAHS